MKKVEIYTDGACKGNPGNGGWGALLIFGEHTKEIFGGEKDTTNNRMEILAAIKALETIKQPCLIHVHTDSQYVRNGINTWMVNWKKNNWKTSNKKDVKNKDLWQRLDQISAKYNVIWHWVKGHSGHVYNERADELANRGVESL